MTTYILGFNGERFDTVTRTTHPGNGYRTYHPRLLRFSSPDGWSPFGYGGINPYAFCAGDPINRADPSGHHSLWGWAGICAGVAMGVLLTPVSWGTSLAVAISAVSVVSAVVSTGLAIAEQFIEKSAPKTATTLGWAALGMGLVSGLSSAALTRIAPGSTSLLRLLKNTGKTVTPLSAEVRQTAAGFQMQGLSTDATAFSSAAEIRDQGQFLGRGAFGEAWKNDDRVYKIYHNRPSLIRTCPKGTLTRQRILHSVKEWNYFYNTAYSGRFSTFASASALSFSDSEILNTPFIGEAFPATSWLHSPENAELENELARLNRELEDNNVTNVRMLDGKAVVIDFDLVVYRNSHAQNRMLSEFGFT